MKSPQTSSFLGEEGNWWNPNVLKAKAWTCGYCGNLVSSDRGYHGTVNEDGSGQECAGIRICPQCKGPTFFTPEGIQHPRITIGESVPNVPPKLGMLYDEARASATAGAYTAAVLTCRKMLERFAKI